MKISDIDFYANSNSSKLHTINPSIKILLLAVILLTCMFSLVYYIPAVVYAVLLLFVLFSNVKKSGILILSIYPVIFMAFYLFSFKNPSLNYMLLIIFRVLCISMALALMIFTTRYIDIFRVLERFFPKFFVQVLFLTYRSIFILFTVLDNIMLSFRLRGVSRKIGIKRYMSTIGNYLGYFIIKSVDTAENLNTALTLRGYSQNDR